MYASAQSRRNNHRNLHTNYETSAKCNSPCERFLLNAQLNRFHAVTTDELTKTRISVVRQRSFHHAGTGHCVYHGTRSYVKRLRLRVAQDPGITRNSAARNLVNSGITHPIQQRHLWCCPRDFTGSVVAEIQRPAAEHTGHKCIAGQHHCPLGAGSVETIARPARRASCGPAARRIGLRVGRAQQVWRF